MVMANGRGYAEKSTPGVSTELKMLTSGSIPE